MQITLDLALSGREWKKNVQKKKDQWKPPASGTIKINTYASFIETTMSGGTGLVVRDHRENMIRAQYLWYEHAANAMTMEALAIREGARLAVERGYKHLIIESDSSGYYLCNGGDHNRTEIMVVFQEVREIGRAFSSLALFLIYKDLRIRKKSVQL
jgi:hypothetical protein